MTDISKLSLEERAKRYRELAVEANQHAALATEAQAQQGFNLIALHWVQLAEWVEAQLPMPPTKD